MPGPGKLEQYDVTPQEYRNIQDRQTLRKELRTEFLRLYQNPHKAATGEGGFGVDPVLQRWIALKSQQWHYFKPNPKTLIYPFFLFFSVGLYGYLIQEERKDRERDYRSGIISYRDRKDKWVH